MNLSGNIDGCNIKKNPGCRRNTNKHAEKTTLKTLGSPQRVGENQLEQGWESLGSLPLDMDMLSSQTI
jgi:hypothetical protein